MKDNKLPDYIRIDNGVATIDLIKGLQIGERVYHRLIMRDASTGDLMDAEDSAPAHKSMQYNGALIAITLTQAICTQGEPHTFEGPFSVTMVRRLHKHDYGRMQEALIALANLSGEE